MVLFHHHHWFFFPHLLDCTFLFTYWFVMDSPRDDPSKLIETRSFLWVYLIGMVGFVWTIGEVHVTGTYLIVHGVLHMFFLAQSTYHMAHELSGNILVSILLFIQEVSHWICLLSALFWDSAPKSFRVCLMFLSFVFWMLNSLKMFQIGTMITNYGRTKQFFLLVIRLTAFAFWFTLFIAFPAFSPFSFIFTVTANDGIREKQGIDRDLSSLGFFLCFGEAVFLLFHLMSAIKT